MLDNSRSLRGCWTIHVARPLRLMLTELFVRRIQLGPSCHFHAAFLSSTRVRAIGHLEKATEGVV
jgi:hypothetical protein